jgi:imidazolonepropionase-like amidohydrolase
MQRYLRVFGAIGLAMVAANSAVAQTERLVPTLFTNVRVFDGRSDELTPPANVLVDGNTIKLVSTEPLTDEQRGQATEIDGGGRTLMPGLIDAHWHAALASIPRPIAHQGDIGYINLLAAKEARALLLRGFTTIRDLGGATFALKRAIDEGVVVGPRIYPSGAAISQTGGHGDNRPAYEIPAPPSAQLTYTERIGQTIIADGPDEVLLRVREQLMQGATQIKLMAGGGVASDFDPLDVMQYTEPELRAAVVAADNWGTYVAVHAYTPRAIQIAIHSGVKCIEHGQLLDEPTAELMAEKGIWLSIQPFVGEEFASRFEGKNREKAELVIRGTDNAYKLAKKHQLKVAWGSDIVFSPHLMRTHGEQLTKLAAWYTPPEILEMATATNAELLALCGTRNPYPGKLGVIEEGAYADLLIVDGNPLEDIKLLEQPNKNIVFIMKDGDIYKNRIK